MSKNKKLFFIALALGNMIVMGPGACGEMTDGFNSVDPTPMVAAWVPPSQRGDLTAEEETELLAEVEFSLDGNPSDEVAVFVDTTMLIRLNVGKKVRVPLEGNDRCSVNLKILNAEGDWEFAKSVSCIDHAPYASIGFTVEGTSVKVSEGAWR